MLGFILFIDEKIKGKKMCNWINFVIGGGFLAYGFTLTDDDAERRAWLPKSIIIGIGILTILGGFFTRCNESL